MTMPTGKSDALTEGQIVELLKNDARHQDPIVESAVIELLGHQIEIRLIKRPHMGELRICIPDDHAGGWSITSTSLGHFNTAPTAEGGPDMGAQPSQPVVHDSRILWYLAPDTTLVEIDSGRQFTVGRQPGELWLGTTPCTVSALDMPVQILGRWHGAT